MGPASILLLLLVGSALAPALGRGRWAGWALAALPAAGLGWLIGQTPAILDQGALAGSFPWPLPLDPDLTWRIDGLGLLFGGLILGVGALVILYAGAYLADEPRRGTLWSLLLLFLAAMLLVVWGDHGLVLFAGWELTSLTSFLLVGFRREEAEARASALQALLVTGLGGLAILAGFALLAQTLGTWQISAWLGAREALAGHPAAPWIMVLILLGALTKSAQFPFHFWLPNAMAAPTPVSALLHSATMVKAGVFLTARLAPLFGQMPLWSAILAGAGLTTFLLGAVRGLGEHDLKRVLAYSTVSTLGLLFLLLGLGHELALQSMIVLLIGHALYKAALFLAAGSVDHGTGTRHLEHLGGLWRAMPLTALGAFLAALSLAGFPPFFGFIGKEFVYKSKLLLDPLTIPLVTAAMAGNMLLLALALRVGWSPFAGAPRSERARQAHEGVPELWGPPLLLAGLGLLAGLSPQLWARLLVEPALTALAGEAIPLELALWHGFNLPLLLSFLTFLGGLAVYRLGTSRGWDLPGVAWRRGHSQTVYDDLLAALKSGSLQVTRRLQDRPLRTHLRALLAVLLILLTWAAVTTAPAASPGTAGPNGVPPALFPAGLALLMAFAGGRASSARTLAPVVGWLGLVGAGVALWFLYYGAPDLALTQLVVEILTLALLALAWKGLSGAPAPERTLLRDRLLAGGLGLAVAVGVYGALSTEGHGDPVSATLSAWSQPLAHGRNVVNVILVDFRALDTLGEIAVLLVVGLGALLLAADRATPRNDGAATPSWLLRTTARWLPAVLLALAAAAWWRGHHQPGGGFVAGLVAASAFTLLALAEGAAEARRRLRLDPLRLAAAGLLLALGSGLVGPLTGQPFLTGHWVFWGPLALGTPLLFDLGVAAVVAGFVLQVVFSLLEEEQGS